MTGRAWSLHTIQGFSEMPDSQDGILTSDCRHQWSWHTINRQRECPGDLGGSTARLELPDRFPMSNSLVEKVSSTCAPLKCPSHMVVAARTTAKMCPLLVRFRALEGRGLHLSRECSWLGVSLSVGQLLLARAKQRIQREREGSS